MASLLAQEHTPNGSRVAMASAPDTRRSSGICRLYYGGFKNSQERAVEQSVFLMDHCRQGERRHSPAPLHWRLLL